MISEIIEDLNLKMIENHIIKIVLFISEDRIVEQI